MKIQLGCLFALLLAGVSGLCWAAESDEQQAIRILRSNASLSDKDAACDRLKIIGTSHAVPALAELLTNPDLSHSARHALEPMPLSEAGRALLEALPKTSGLIQIGIISSLAVRGEVKAVPALAGLLNSSDQQVAVASARALGQIGLPTAIGPLQSCASHNSTGPLHEAAIDGLFRCANKLVAAGRNSRAVSIYEHLYNSEKNETVQVAAFRGMIRSSGDHGVRLMTRAIANEPSAAQMAALQCAHELPGAAVTEALARLLPHLDEPRQIAVLMALAQRNDPVAAPMVASLVTAGNDRIRVEGLKTLGRVGDVSQVPLIADFAAVGTPLQQAAAREALVTLRRGKVGETIVSQLATSGPEVQAELARALGQRGDKSAIPKLFLIAEEGSPSARKAALKALGMLIDDSDVPTLVRYIATSKDPTARAEGSDALNFACQHIVSKRGRMNFNPLVKGILLGKKEARIALLPVCSSLINPQVRVAIRSGFNDADPEVRAVGVRALCDTADPDLLEDIIGIARTSKQQNFRSLAIAAGVRLTTQEENTKISRGQRVVALKTLLTAANRPEDKRLILAGLAEMPDSDALRTVEPLLDDETLHNEAARAAVKIAIALPGGYAKESMAALQKGLGSVTDEPTKQAIEAALKQLQDSIDYISDWMVAGPFQQNGKDYVALFDIVFPPETETAKGVDWKPLPAGADPKRPFVMDLFKVFGGQQCVAYARTWIESEKEQPMRLELGSDDGVKVWLNDKQVYTLNTARALTPGSDKVNLKLNAGWNMLLLKITQNNLGWEFCARLVNADGSHCDNLKIEAAPKTTSADTK